MSAAGADSGTTAVREGYGFDERRLVEWLMDEVADFAGPVTVEQFRGGQSNPTYKLMTPAKSYVLRRKPPGELLKGAHAIEREARVLAALEQVGYPVAHVHALCTDETVIGTWFYVMNMVEGRVFWDATLPDVRSAERPAYYDAMNEAIARLHTVDYAAIGLGDFGRPGNYFARQLDRWSSQYLADVEAGGDADMDRLIEWLSANLPAEEEIALVHGDFRIDNLIFHQREPRILAVLDWELSTLGHPLADFAYHAMTYHMPPQIVAGLAGADLQALNLPSEHDYVAAYCRRTRRDAIPDYRFYIAFNFFRLAAIFHGIKGRVIRGTAASAQAAERAGSFSQLARIGLEQTRLSQ